MLKDNINYEVAFVSKNNCTNKEVIFYTLKNKAEYHLSRFVAASAQNIYSEAGLTKPLLTKLCDKMIESINKNKLDEVSVLVNNIRARMAYPIDENAALRMAMIYHFLENEDPNKCENQFTEHKLKIVLSDPEAYSFFLPLGLIHTPAYTEYLEEVSQNYLDQRRSTLSQLQIH